jgi:hypothetical protein
VVKTQVVPRFVRQQGAKTGYYNAVCGAAARRHGGVAAGVHPEPGTALKTGHNFPVHGADVPDVDIAAWVPLHQVLKAGIFNQRVQVPAKKRRGAGNAGGNAAVRCFACQAKPDPGISAGTPA